MDNSSSSKSDGFGGLVSSAIGKMTSVQLPLPKLRLMVTSFSSRRPSN
ncbi:hypothetical protein BDA96_09G185900 [Sorghum bicolor]|uniref:Uncharacterized protein n=2 Tax=Sorghum bicolor TaxID=4558 RepID=A0A921QCL7_SORBI|nr:hypothetical protein BDA96_09G185900 [Sorghum bicolor]OQU78202.1 hypothetical protein SORBI_3009G176333 [Sorghum bicolor]